MLCARRVTADACPAAAQIVGHKIDEVEVLRRACPVLPRKRIRRAGCAGRQRFSAGAERTVHGGAKLCQQQNEVFAVFRFRAGLRFRFQFAKYKTACRTGLALPFRLFCSDYKRAAFPMQRFRLTSTTTGKKSKDIRQRLFAHIGGSMVYCGQGFPRRGRRLVHTNCIRLLFAF